MFKGIRHNRHKQAPPTSARIEALAALLHHLPVPYSLAGQGSSIASRDRLLRLRQTHELFRATHGNAEKRRTRIAAFGHRSALFHILDSELATRRADLLEAVAASTIRALTPESDTSVRHDATQETNDGGSR